MIPVTKPFLPPIEEYEQYLKDIWKRNWLTNNGPLVNELELKLKEFLDLKHLLYVTNGTIALQLAIKALGLKGKIIYNTFFICGNDKQYRVGGMRAFICRYRS